MRRTLFKRIFVAILCLLAVVATGTGVYLFHYHQRGIEFRYASAFEIPTFNAGRTSLRQLAGDEYEKFDSLLAALRTHIEETEFKPYTERLPGAPQARIVKLEKNGFRVRNNPPWFPGSAVDWNLDPEDDRNWRFRMNALDHLAAFEADYLKHNNISSFRAFKEGVFDWINYNLVENGENEFKWYDMSTGLRAIRLAHLLEQGVSKDLLAPADIRLLLAAMDMHVEVLVNQRLLNHGNHGLFQMLGLAAMCKVAPVLESCVEGKVFARSTFQKIARAQFTADGIHAEHSSQYHPWAISTIEAMLRYEYLDGVDVSFLEQAKARAIHFFYPNGEMTLLGDTGAQHVCSVRELHPHLEYLCSKGKSGEQPDSGLMIFRDSGYAIARSDWDARPLSQQTYLFLNAAYHSQAHKQSDDFSILWYEAGTPVLVDSGKYSYNTDEMRAYMQSTRAHNTVEIDETDYPRTLQKAYGSALQLGTVVNGINLVVAEVFRSESDVGHRRIVVNEPGVFLLVVDVLNGSTKHQYRQWFHFHEDLDVRVTEDFLEILGPEGNSVVRGRFAASEENAVSLVVGQRTPRLQGWRSSKYMQVAENVAVSNQVDASSAILLAGFVLSSDGQDISLSQQGPHEVRFCFDANRGVVLDTDSFQLREITCVERLQ